MAKRSSQAPEQKIRGKNPAKRVSSRGSTERQPSRQRRGNQPGS